MAVVLTSCEIFAGARCSNRLKPHQQGVLNAIKLLSQFTSNKSITIVALLFSRTSRTQLC